jgi:cell division protein FtsI (penicillin-binding protein 3)
MRPYLVERIIDEKGVEIQRFEPQLIRRVISPETALKVSKMMETVTGEGGTGTKAAIEGFRVAGKTGTAQKVDPVTRAYSPTKRIGSFVGFVPADKPKLTIAVIIDEPQGVKYGGVVAAPAFRGIAQNSLAYLKISPILPAGQPPRALEAKTVVQPTDESLAEDDADTPDDSTAGAVMPNFHGMSMRKVLQVMEKHGINIRLIGSGRAAEQSPPPGNTIRNADKVWVKFIPAA